MPTGVLLPAQAEEQCQPSFLACCMLGWRGTMRAASCCKTTKNQNQTKSDQLFTPFWNESFPFSCSMEISKSLSQAAPPASPQQEDHLAAWQNVCTTTAPCSFFLHSSTCFLNVTLPLVAKVHTIPPEPIRHCSARLHFGLFHLHAPVGDTKMSCLLRLQILQSRQMCASVAPH